MVGGTGGAGSTGTLSALLAVTQLAFTQPLPVGANGTLTAHHWLSSLFPTILAVLPVKRRV